MNSSAQADWLVGRSAVRRRKDPTWRDTEQPDAGFFKRWKARLEPIFQDDTAFVELAFEQILGRKVETEAAAGKPFSTLHVDELGYPIHGHLIWADSGWWTSRFESHGFSRDIEIEQALHAKYDRYMAARAPARRSFFVFRKPGAAARSEAIARSIGAAESATLSDYRAT